MVSCFLFRRLLNPSSLPLPYTNCGIYPSRAFFLICGRKYGGILSLGQETPDWWSGYERDLCGRFCDPAYHDHTRDSYPYAQIRVPYLVAPTPASQVAGLWLSEQCQAAEHVRADISSLVLALSNVADVRAVG